MDDDGSVHLRFDGVDKRYGEHLVLDDFSLNCEPGAVTALIGSNGAGKSTALRILLGLVRADDGAATIGGRAFHELPHPAQVVGALLPDSGFHPRQRVREVLTSLSPLAGADEARCDELLERVGLSDAARSRTKTLSTGMTVRLKVAIALLGEPAALVLDEPSDGLDAEGSRVLRELLREQADAGGTVLLTNHRLDEVEATADRVVLLQSGRPVYNGSVSSLRRRVGVVHELEPSDAARLLTHLASLRIRALGRAGKVTTVAADEDELRRAVADLGLDLRSIRSRDPRLDELVEVLQESAA